MANLGHLGIRVGDCVLVHSSYDAFGGFTGKPSDVISVLQRAIGSSGSLMMPTMPFTGTAVDYARSKPVFHVRHTASRMGLLSEVFRRSRDVIRSVHPTHSVAVWGANADALVDRHHFCSTPCGNGSPYARLLERQGKILLMGTDVGVLTFYHTVEERLDGTLPVSPFTREVFTLLSRDYSDNVVVTHTRLFEPATSRRRNLYKLGAGLRERGMWRERRIGELRLIALNAEDVLVTAEAMADKGTYCYD